MARRPRIHFPGALYHVILRGNDRQQIFFLDSDRSLWESLLVAAIQRYEARIHCYCWMTNHVHMVVQVGQEPLASTIRYSASQYSRQINKRMQRTGHLFERRHRAILVKDDTYLLGLARYIHNNPLRAGLVHSIGEYRWSSHPVYAGQIVTSWLETRTVLQLFGSTTPVARRRYRAFMHAHDDTEDLSQYRNGPDEEDEVPDDQPEDIGDPSPQRSKCNHPTLDSIIQAHLQRSGITEAMLVGPSRARLVAGVRTDIAMEALEAGVCNIAELSRRLNRSESAISQAVSARRNALRRTT